MNPGLFLQTVSKLPVNSFDFICRKMMITTLKLLAPSTFVNLANAQLCLACDSLRIRMLWRAVINSAVKSAQSEERVRLLQSNFNKMLPIFPSKVI